MIPVCEPVLTAAEMENVQECMATGWISSSGRFINEFEEKWAAYCGMGYGIAVSNGTTALQLAVSVLDLSPGDEVILPSFTIVSCALAVLYNGGIPVLVDCDPDTWCMDVSSVEAAITPRTRAIMPVHIYGHPVDMSPIRELASRYNLAIIEDAAEAHGARYKDIPCGGLGDMSCFSFYANKIITTGEGGMVLTNDAVFAEKLRSRRNLSFQRDRRFYHEDMGFNFRLTNVQAAIGSAQIDRIEDLVDQKRKIAAQYRARLVSSSKLQLPVERSWAKNVYWMFAIVLKESYSESAAYVSSRLADLGIQTRPFFLGLHQQPVFHRMGLFTDTSLPVTERIADRGFYLPSGLSLEEAQIDHICDVLCEVLESV